MEHDNLRAEVKKVLTKTMQDIHVVIRESLSADIDRRKSTLNPDALATVLAGTALGGLSEKTKLWLDSHVQELNDVHITTPSSEVYPPMLACCVVLEKMCGMTLPPNVQEIIYPAERTAKFLKYPLSLDSSYTLPLHLACDVLLSPEGETPEALEMLCDLQQKDGSWTDDVIITALSALALQKANMNPLYDVQKWLQREQLPDGSWPVANGEVWEAAAALRTGKVNVPTLMAVLKVCMHQNHWWGYSRYAVPDTDDTAAACCALAPYEPESTSKSCENLLKVQHENGGWDAFPQVEGVVPFETVTGCARTTSNDITCHVLEALEYHNKGETLPFKKGIDFLLGAQRQDGHWKTTWWNSNIFGTTEIALLLDRHGYEEPVSRALQWLNNNLDERLEHLNSMECALLVKAFSQIPGHPDSLGKALHLFLEKYPGVVCPTYDSVYFAGLIDSTLYRLSVVVSALYAYLRN